MSIGDVSSNARGSGARYNDGKVAFELLPLRLLLDWLSDNGLLPTEGFDDLREMLFHLADWQEGDDAALDAALIAALPEPGLAGFTEAARVFEYGKKKYAAWNWAKGMPWSVPLGCIIRHSVFGEMAGEPIDPESGKKHRGHILCNLVMLLLYQQNYPEGDDRPKEWLRHV